jgi:hypothetical protein
LRRAHQFRPASTDSPIYSRDREFPPLPSLPTRARIVAADLHSVTRPLYDRRYSGQGFWHQKQARNQGHPAIIAAINDLEPTIQQLSDIDLAAKTIEFKEKLAQGAPLDDLLVEAFAVVREAGRRFLNMRHFDVQLIGGIVLHREMRKG